MPSFLLLISKTGFYQLRAVDILCRYIFIVEYFLMNHGMVSSIPQSLLTSRHKDIISVANINVSVQLKISPRCYYIFQGCGVGSPLLKITILPVSSSWALLNIPSAGHLFFLCTFTRHWDFIFLPYCMFVIFLKHTIPYLYVFVYSANFFSFAKPIFKIYLLLWEHACFRIGTKEGNLERTVAAPKAEVLDTASLWVR